MHRGGNNHGPWENVAWERRSLKARMVVSASIFLAEPLHSSRFPLARLIQLIILLQTERCPNARRLAEICEVSRRTIYRDLAALAGAGIAVIYRSDRQGYQLAQERVSATSKD